MQLRVVPAQHYMSYTVAWASRSRGPWYIANWRCKRYPKMAWDWGGGGGSLSPRHTMGPWHWLCVFRSHIYLSHIAAWTPTSCCAWCMAAQLCTRSSKSPWDLRHMKVSHVKQSASHGGRERDGSGVYFQYTAASRSLPPGRPRAALPGTLQPGYADAPRSGIAAQGT